LELKNYLKNCDPKKTFFVLQSKSFKTPELLFLANHAESWLKSNGCPSKRLLEFFAVVTSNKQAALDKGYLESYIFEIPKELGGRFSIWSTMGLSIALLIGKAQFENFLQGGQQADMHFLKADIKKIFR
jgi:glucose-6-phosphate isomerase